jgi:hypothetical protein
MNNRSTQSKINGAKSLGPTSPEGKARSSQNSLKHGLHSKQILLPSESREEFDALRASYLDQFQPASPVELELVESLAITRWRLRRLASIEANLLENELLEDASDMDEQVNEAGPEAHLAWSFARLSNRPALTLLMRHEATLSRTFDRTLKQLQLLQSQRVPPPPQKLQNEPKSAPVSTQNRDCKGADDPSTPPRTPVDNCPTPVMPVAPMRPDSPTVL